ncbi:hypothetical protein QUB61_31230 [Microcoleus sp. C2D2]
MPVQDWLFWRCLLYCMLRQELTIAYQHGQQGNSGHRTVQFPYPNIIDRPIGCHDRQPGY